MKMQEYEASKKGAGKKASAKAAAKKVPAKAAAKKAPAKAAAKKVPAKAAGKTILKPVMRHNFEAEAAVIKKNGKKK